MAGKSEQVLKLNKKKEGDEGSVYQCPFMRVPECFRQSMDQPLSVAICQACILGRIEKHLFTISKKDVPPTRFIPELK